MTRRIDTVSIYRHIVSSLVKITVKWNVRGGYVCKVSQMLVEILSVPDQNVQEAT